MAWALAAQGIVGVWGKVCEDGAVVLNQREAQGDAVYINIDDHAVYSAKGDKALSGNFQFLRLDSTVKKREIIMKEEQLLTFLLNRTTYFDIKVLPVPIKQVVQALARTCEGVISPQYSFDGRDNLSL